MPHLPTSMKVRLMAAMVIVSLSGCQWIGPNYLRPEIKLPEAFTPTSENSNPDTLPLTQAWWERFNDETLNRLMQQTLEQNRVLAKAMAAIEQAEAYAHEVGAASLPSVNLSSNAVRTRATEAGAFPVFAANPRPDYTYQLSTQFEVDVWGKLRRAKESAAAQWLSSQYAKETIALSLESMVANDYIQLRGLDARIGWLQQTLNTREASLTLMRQRLEGGIASLLEVHQSEAEIANTVAQLAELKRQRALLEHHLGLLTGRLDTQLAVYSEFSLPLPPLPPVGLPSTLLERRPDVLQAEQTLVAANANIGVAKSALYPTISLTGAFGGESLELRDLLSSPARVWNIGVDLYLPVFNSGKLSARVDQVTAQQKQALHSYAYTVQTAFTEVNDALVNLHQQAERDTALEQAKVATERALRIADHRHKAGYSSYLEVLDAQRSVQEASLASIQTREARLLASVELMKALGGGWKGP